MDFEIFIFLQCSYCCQSSVITTVLCLYQYWFTFHDSTGLLDFFYLRMQHLYLYWAFLCCVTCSSISTIALSKLLTMRGVQFNKHLLVNVCTCIVIIFSKSQLGEPEIPEINTAHQLKICASNFSSSQPGHTPLANSSLYGPPPTVRANLSLIYP